MANDARLDEVDGGAKSPQRAEDGPRSSDSSLAHAALQFAKQSEKLSHESRSNDAATEARFVTDQDPVIVTEEGHRLPGVPLEEAHKLNVLRDELQQDTSDAIQIKNGSKTPKLISQGGSATPDSPKVIDVEAEKRDGSIQKSAEGNLRRAMPPSHTNPLFPPLPLYGPPSLLRNLQIIVFRISSFFLSLAFLGVIVLGALFTSLPPLCKRIFHLLTLRNPDKKRPFYEEEKRRKKTRKEQNRAWKRKRGQTGANEDKENPAGDADGFVPSEGGPDPIVCDVGYYARRVGLDVEELQVQTEDGFILDLWHVYDPREYTPLPQAERGHRGPDIFQDEKRPPRDHKGTGKPKFPVLLMHGLLQSSGAYCVNDDDSLAFYLCKAGYDVWLGNNRCGFKPKHALLKYADPRMWCWNIRQMGVFDLPALTSRVLFETGFPRIGLVAHSQGTTQTLVALAKEQRPELGERLTVFCALAPAAYAGPLIGKMYFKFMRVITPAMFRLMFGIHAFIPFMMTMHRLLPGGIYGWLGYKVFGFLFDWSDTRWDRALKNRMFQFAPVYVSAESMRWWLGRECFAKHKCILATKEEWRAEEREDADGPVAAASTAAKRPSAAHHPEKAAETHDADERAVAAHRRKPRGSTAWYDERAPPFALWVCGSDDLVDGRKLLRRFQRGREPHVRVVHEKVVEAYEHLDVIWAMDAVDQVFGEVKEVLWKTCDARERCRVPRGCEDVAEWVREERPAADGDDSGQSSSSSEDLLA
jgi:pimeloyl-ACP methyl ester carboxylesterase